MPVAIALALMLGGCAHASLSLTAGASSAASSSAGLQVSSSGGGAVTALLAGVVIAGTMQDRDVAEREPPMDPSRTVNEQDCTKPLTGSGNLRCR